MPTLDNAKLKEVNQLILSIKNEVNKDYYNNTCQKINHIVEMNDAILLDQMIFELKIFTFAIND